MAAVNVLKSGKVNQWTGTEVDRFQDKFAAYCGVRYGVAVANGSVALDLALWALGIGPGDEVIIPPRTFIATAGCIVLRGAKPVFADVHPDTQNITADEIRKVITPQTKAIIAVHLAGWPCDMDPIMELAEEFGIKVIEDCAQSHGAIYYSKFPGCKSTFGVPPTIERAGVLLYPRMTGSLGHIAAFSFCQDKIVTTAGEGGMLLTNDESLWEKAWAFKDHGKNYDAIYRRPHSPGFRWIHESFGTNFRMTEVQAAIGLAQLKKLPRWTNQRRINAAVLSAGFSRIPGLRLTIPTREVIHGYYKYYVFVEPAFLKSDWSRDRIVSDISASKIPCFSGICGEIYLEKAFDADGLRPAKRLPVARKLGETSMMFLVHPTLSEVDMEETIRVVHRVMRSAAK